MSELVIKINGDIKNFKEALDQAGKATEDLSGALSTTAKVSGVAFAVLTAEIGLAVKAYGESEAASRKLSQALQNQGVYSQELSDKYKEYASQVQKVTGLDDDAVVAAQAALQAKIGNIKITQDLTMAIADLAENQKISLDSAAEFIGKGINGQTAAMKKLGIEVDAHVSAQERMGQIVAGVTQQMGGQAAAANQGQGSIRGMTNAFGNLQEAIGQRFAPVMEQIYLSLTKVFTYMSENKAVVDFAVSLLTAGAAVTGIVTAVSAAGAAFLALKAALAAANISIAATTLGVRALVGATGIGLLVLLVTEIALNWNSVWPRMQAVFTTFVNNISTLGTGLAKILGGVFTFDLGLIKEGLNQAKNAFTQGYEEYKTTVTKKIDEMTKIEVEGQMKQDETKAKLAATAQAKKQKQYEAERAALEAEEELKLLKVEEASAAMIALKQAEVDALKLIADEKFEGDKEALALRAEELRTLEEEQKALDDEQRTAFAEDILAKNAEYQGLSDAQKALFRQQNEAKMREGILTEKSALMAAAADKAQQQIKDNNTFLLEQQKFGTAYALVNKAMHSDIYKGTGQAMGELVPLMQSKHQALFQIGRQAAKAQIIMKTAESAMSIFAGFSTIPIVGPALGLAGAAAAIAYGGEQLSALNNTSFTGAATGGLMTGGIAGRDSIPTMTMPGELVSPTNSFEEVIGSVRAKREADKIMEATGSGAGGTMSVLVGFDGVEASRVLTIKQIEDRSLGTSPETAAS